MAPDSVPGLVRQHGCGVEPPPDLSGHLQKRPVLLVRNDDANRILLDGLPETLERVSVEGQAAVLVSRPRGPVEHRHQEREVPSDGLVGHGLATRRARMNRCQCLRNSVSGLRLRPRKSRNIAVAARSCMRNVYALADVSSSP